MLDAADPDAQWLREEGESPVLPGQSLLLGGDWLKLTHGFFSRGGAFSILALGLADGLLQSLQNVLRTRPSGALRRGGGSNRASSASARQAMPLGGGAFREPDK
jgi:hypothetical protein